MVLYFTSNVVDPPALIYMGKDKFENEDLIKYGFEQDVWFHVDQLSSAHVYLRLKEGESWENIPPALLEDCAQLTKANSIEGSKKNNLSIIYTPWANLKKTQGMDTGTVMFFRDKMITETSAMHNTPQVKRIHVTTKNKDILNRLNKTKEEKYPDLAKEKLDKEKAQRMTQKEFEKKRKQEALEAEKKKREKEALKNYTGVFEEDSMSTNRGNSASSLEDDFM